MRRCRLELCIYILKPNICLIADEFIFEGFKRHDELLKPGCGAF